MMKYLQATRKIHMWLGLIVSVFLLIEAITGLLLAEPWLIGVNKAQSQNINLGADRQNKTPIANFNDGKAVDIPKQAPNHVTSLGFVKKLHQGIVGDQNFKWLADITAISIMILSFTGIYLSIPILRAKSKKRL